jgi:recombinational DNA repair protein (RecF pathway)
VAYDLDNEKIIDIIIEQNEKQKELCDNTLETLKIINKQNCIKEIIIVVFILIFLLLLNLS